MGKASKKKNIILILLLTLTVTFSSVNVYSVDIPSLPNIYNLATGLSKIMGDTIGFDPVQSLKDQVKDSVRKAITDEMIMGTGQSVYDTGVLGLDALLKGTATAFGPQSSLFDVVINTGEDPKTARNHSNASHLEPDTVTGFIVSVSQVFGYFVSGLLLIIGLMSFAFNGNIYEIRDTPLKLLGRFILSCFFIRWAPEIMFGELMFRFSLLWNDIMTVGDNALALQHFSAYLTDNPESQYFYILDIVIDTMNNPVVGIMLMVIGLYITWRLLKGYFKLFIEVVQRYILVCLFGYIFPAVGGTITSSGTSGIFTAYLKLFFSQMFLLFMDCIFIRTFVMLLAHGTFTHSIIGYIFGISMLSVFLHFDQYIASLGINVAQMGAGVRDAVLMGGTNLRQMAYGARAFNGARKTVGKAASATGLLANKQELFNAGQFLSNLSLSNSSASGSTYKNAATPEGKDRRYEQARANAGLMSKDGHAAERLHEAFSNKDYANDAAEAWGSYPVEARRDAIMSDLEGLYGKKNNLVLNNFNDDNIKKGEIGLDMSVNGEHVTGTLSKKENRNGIKVNDGMYFNIDPNNKIAQHGTKVSEFKNADELRALMINNGTYSSLQKLQSHKIQTDNPADLFSEKFQKGQNPNLRHQGQNAENVMSKEGTKPGDINKNVMSREDTKPGDINNIDANQSLSKSNISAEEFLFDSTMNGGSLIAHTNGEGQIVGYTINANSKAKAEKIQRDENGKAILDSKGRTIPLKDKDGNRLFEPTTQHGVAQISTKTGNIRFGSELASKASGGEFYRFNNKDVTSTSAANKGNVTLTARRAIVDSQTMTNFSNEMGFDKNSIKNVVSNEKAHTISFDATKTNGQLGSYTIGDKIAGAKMPAVPKGNKSYQTDTFAGYGSAFIVDTTVRNKGPQPTPKIK